jgi:hypothetical protein
MFVEVDADETYGGSFESLSWGAGAGPGGDLRQLFRLRPDLYAAPAGKPPAPVEHE